MGCRKNKFSAQQIQKAVYKIGKENRKLPWIGAIIKQHHYIQKDNFGIGSKFEMINNVDCCLQDLNQIQFIDYKFVFSLFIWNFMHVYIPIAIKNFQFIIF